jgi:hypothetical protein
MMLRAVMTACVKSVVTTLICVSSSLTGRELGVNVCRKVEIRQEKVGIVIARAPGAAIGSDVAESEV